MMITKRVPMSRLAAIAIALALTVGCATSTPTLDTSADAESSYDGLTPMQDTLADRVWVRPDFDLSGYTKLLVQPAGIQYRPVKQTSRMRSRSSDTFPLTDKQKSLLLEIVSEEFEKALGELKRYVIVAEPGPEVLLLRGALLDVISRVPSEGAGRVDFYLDSVGEATLLIELADSQSGTTLVRVLDRRAAARGYLQQASVVTTRAEARRLARNWANLLVKRLEQVSDLSTVSNN